MSLKNDEEDRVRKFPEDLSAYAGTLVKVKKPALFEICSETLALAFDKICKQKWLDLLNVYDHALFIEVFELAIDKGRINTLKHHFNLLAHFFQKPSAFIFNEIDKIPKYIERTDLFSNKINNYSYNKKERKEQIKAILTDVILLSKHKEKDEKWLEDCLNSITEKASRKNINKILVPQFCKNKEGAFYCAMQQFCLADLQKRTASEPQPPKTWKRSVPKTNDYYAAVWEVLRDFIESPTETTFDFRANQARRNQVLNAILNVNIDLKTETIKKGSPHTLRITKTQKAYEKELKNYKEDLKLLVKFKV